MRQMRAIHKYFGLITFTIVTVVAVTGILLTHRKALGLNKVMVSVPGYSSEQAIDSADMLITDEGKAVVATRQGVFIRERGEWKTSLLSPTKKLYEKNGSLYACSKNGLYESKDGITWSNLFAGEEVKTILFIEDEISAATANGIYRKKLVPGEEWKTVVEFPRKPLDVREFVYGGDEVVIAAKEGVFTFRYGNGFLTETLPVKKKAGVKVDLQKVITDLHTGDFFGRYFYLFMDVSAIGLVAMSITGVYIWYRPRKKKARP